MTKRALLRTILPVGVLAIMAGCAEVPAPSTTSTAVAPPPSGYWNGDGVPGAPKIVVSISDQRAYFFKGKRLVGQSTVSTGKPGFSTPPGQYTVVWKDKDHVSTVFGDYVDDFGNVVKSNIDARKDSRPPGSHYDGARMPFAMFFRGGYAMHQGYVPPYAASHGCIRLPAGMAEPFFNNAPLGTPVIVKDSPVEYVSRDQPDQIPPFVPAPAPNLVRSPAPAPVPPASVRSTVPDPVRSPAPVVLRAPATVPTPAPLRTPVPSAYRNSSPVLLRPPSPAPVRPTSVHSTVPVPTPTPVRSPAPNSVRSPATPSVSPTPTPTHSRKHRRVHSRPHVPSSAPSPTPTPPR